MRIARGTVSSNIIDKRKHVASGAIAGIIATLLGVFGVNLATGTDADPDRDLVFVVSTALDRGQSYWEARMPGYRAARVVIFEDSTRSACGYALTQSGPFYCPADERLYVDLRFLRSLGDGDLGIAVIVGHELGHHVQHLRRTLNGRPDLKVELEADCLAGSWIRDEHQRGLLDPGDIAEALRTIESVGDDRVCPGCSPERWSHGSSAQRLGAVQAGMAGLECLF